MRIDLGGRRAVVTGGTAGIGFAIARGLAAAGAAVVVAGRDEARLAEALRRLPEGSASGVACDLTTAEGAARLIAAAPEADILVNNLGIYERRDFFEIGDDDWLRLYEVNVLSAARLSRHYGLGMRDRGAGRVLFVSSESALQIPADMVHYGVSKAAMLALSRGLAEVMAGTGVTVNAVLPGPSRTERVTAVREAAAAQRGIGMDELEADFFRTARPSSLIRRFAEPEETAHMVVYLASDYASATTGAALRVDGGIVRSIA